jgi:hypothetical protein
MFINFVNAVNNISSISNFIISPLERAAPTKEFGRREEDANTRVQQNPSDNLIQTINQEDVQLPFKPLDVGKNSQNADGKFGLDKNKNQIGTEKSEEEGLVKEEDKSVTNQELTDAEKQQVEELKRIDREVRAHERAHQAAGGGLVRGGASLSYTTGPDGKQYAVAGEVKIEMSPESEPAATIRKMQQVKRAALAPSDPSAQDRSVAQRASQIEAEARRELQKERTEETKESLDGGLKQLEAYQPQKEAVGENFDATSMAAGVASLKQNEKQEADAGPQDFIIYA